MTTKRDRLKRQARVSTLRPVRHIGDGPSGAGYNKGDDHDANNDEGGHYACPNHWGEFRPWPVRGIPTLGKEFHPAIPSRHDRPGKPVVASAIPSVEHHEYKESSDDRNEDHRGHHAQYIARSTPKT